MRNIGIVTVGRSDYGIFQPLLEAIDSDPDLRLELFVSGMHLSPDCGLTVREIERDRWPIACRIPMLISDDTPTGIAVSMGTGVAGFAHAFREHRPDILVVLGDRFETFSAVSSAVPFLIPVAHIGGGAVTMGAFDDGLRHSITKLSHLHFAETETNVRRLVQMGESPWRVTMTGALGLDNLRRVKPMSLDELNAKFGFSLSQAPLLVTFHPVTREYKRVEEQVAALLASLAAFDTPIVLTHPNADTNGRIILRMMEIFAAERPATWLVPNLGLEGYFSLMSHARAMVGNSSSGIVEAASFKLPVVNIGNRQQGRCSAANVIHVEPEPTALTLAIRRAMSDEFRAQLAGLINPYGTGDAAEQIVRVLRQTPLDSRLINKTFHDSSNCEMAKAG